MKFSLTVLFFLCACLSSQSVLAQTVKKWVDEEGVTHYSDVVPESGRLVEEVTLPEVETDSESAEDISRRIKDQVLKMEEERRQREEEAAAEQRERDLEEALGREEIIEAPKKEKKRKKRLIPLKEPGPHIQPSRERELRKNQ